MATIVIIVYHTKVRFYKRNEIQLRRPLVLILELFCRSIIVLSLFSEELIWRSERHHYIQKSQEII